MSFNCKYCGRELPDNAAYCEGCGATFDTYDSETIICLSCGERLAPGTTLCPACGARIYNTAAEGPAEMEALVPPVITDDMFAARSPESENYAIESADESVYSNRPVQPIPQPAAPVPSPAAPQAAVPRPGPAEPIPVPIRPKPHTAPQVAPLLNRPRPAAAPAQPEPVIEEQEAYNSYSSSRFEEAARPQQPYDLHGQPGAYQQAPQIPHNPYPDPARMRVESGKKGRSLVVPIILIILIIAVILVDVFVLFRDRIFGSDDSKASKSSAVITVTEISADNAPQTRVL